MNTITSTIKPTLTRQEGYLTLYIGEGANQKQAAIILPDDRDMSPNWEIARVLGASFEMLEALQALDLNCQHSDLKYHFDTSCSKCRARMALCKATP